MLTKFPLFSALLCASLSLSGCAKSPLAWWKGINEKAEHLATLEAKYNALQLAHHELQAEYYALEHEHAALSARVQSHELAKSNLAATGSVTGRQPASIAYAPPKKLSANELLSLAYEHFREKRFAEAAVSFEEYLAKPEVAAGNNGEAMYSAGVAWFELGNFHKARDAFEGAKRGASGDAKEKIHKKVDLWMRVMDQKVREPAAENGHGG